MTPPDRVSEPVSFSGAPIAMHLEGVAERHAIDLGLAGRAADDDPGHDPDAAGRDRLGSGVAQLVDELLDATAVDGATDRDRDAGAGTGSSPA